MADRAARPPLAILIADASEMRFWSALSCACASAALGRPVRIFCSGAAAGLMRRDRQWDADAHLDARGCPTIAMLLATAAEMTLELGVCQTGMALCDIAADALIDGAMPAGLMTWLAETATHQQLIF